MNPPLIILCFIICFIPQALILDTIHSIDVVQLLQKNSVTSLDDWLWQKQLRFYLDNTQTAIMRMVDAEFQYTYEYQGTLLESFHL